MIVKKGSEARLLWGFISTHKQICTDATCPLQKISLTHTSSSKAQARNVINLTTICRFYTQHQLQSKKIGNLENDDLFVRFRKNIQLKIDYAVFLSRTLKHRQAALVQIEQAETLDPSFDEEFNLLQIK